MKIKWPLIFLCICAIFFYLIKIFTIKPHRWSGNGNLGLLIIFPTIPIILTSIILIIIYVYKLFKRKPKTIPAVTAISGILIIPLAWAEYAFIQQKIEALGGSYDNPESKLYRYPLLNQYTNDLFFNAYTFCGFVVFAILAAGAISLVQMKRAKK